MITALFIGFLMLLVIGVAIVNYLEEWDAREEIFIGCGILFFLLCMFMFKVLEKVDKVFQ